MRYETITMHDVRLGDTILSDGILMLIDRAPQATCHPINQYGPTFATRGRILNWDALVAGEAAADCEFIVAMVQGDKAHAVANGRTPDEEPRWTIQGNALAEVSRVIPARHWWTPGVGRDDLRALQALLDEV